MKKNIAGISATLSLAILTACGGGGSGGGGSRVDLSDAETAAQVAFQAIIVSRLVSVDTELSEPFLYEFEGSAGTTQLFCDTGTAVATESNPNILNLDANRCRLNGDSGFLEYDGVADLNCTEVEPEFDRCNAGTVTFDNYSEAFGNPDDFTTANLDGTAVVSFATTTQTLNIDGEFGRDVISDSDSIRINASYDNFEIGRRNIGTDVRLTLDGAASFSVRGVDNCGSVGEVDLTTLQDLVVSEDNEIEGGSLRITQGEDSALVDFASNGRATVTIDGRTSFIAASTVQEFCTD